MACSFPNFLIRDGVVQKLDKHPAPDIRARTALGINKDQTGPVILVSDGGDHWSRKGMTLAETAQMLKDAGAHLRIMSDGGSSTTLICNPGVPVVLNDVAQWRVAVHLGVNLKGVA